MAVLRNKKGFTRKRDWVQKNNDVIMLKRKEGSWVLIAPALLCIHVVLFSRFMFYSFYVCCIFFFCCPDFHRGHRYIRM